MTRKFIRRIEDFACEHCGEQVSGSGYTNHCPRCLWSKHVDVNPGDRAASCEGMMKPVRVEQDDNEYVLVHRCEHCGAEKRNRVSASDSRDALVALAAAARHG